MSNFEGKLAVLQRVLPQYRAPFFDHLAQKCSGGLTLMAGKPLPIESIKSATSFGYAQINWTTNQHFFHPRHPLFFCRQAGLTEWLVHENPDALIVEANPRYPNTRQTISWMHEHNRPVLGWGLGAPPISGPMANLRVASRARLLASLDGIIAYSKRGAEQYASLKVLPSNRIFTAPNAVAPPPAHNAPLRGALKSPRSVLFVGRLQARKRLDLLFHACAKLPANIQPKLTIVGDGPDRAGFESVALQTYPQAIFTGELHGEALAYQFQAADLFVLPGSGGLAIQEAMSYGLPVIVAEGDGSQDDLVRTENGWLISPGNLAELISVLTIALMDKQLREKGSAGRRIVSEEINLHSMADRFIKAIKTVINQS